MFEHFDNMFLPNNFKTGQDKSEFKMRCLLFQLLYNFMNYFKFSLEWNLSPILIKKHA